MSTINPITKPIHNAIRWFSNRKLPQHAGQKVLNNDRKFIDGLGVASIVAKDGLGCYLYVTQSMNNKDIPEDKRPFVAALDLTNGMLMIALQILMFKTVSNKVTQTKMFDKIFGRIFDRPLKKFYRAHTKTRPEYSDVTDIKYTKDFTSIRNKVRDAFGGLVSLVAATIVGKRMLVPFIATPLAGSVERYLGKNTKAGGDKTNAQQNGESATPSMQGNLDVVSPASTVNMAWKNNSNFLEKYGK